MIEFKKLAIEQVDWDELDRFWDRTVFQTLPWLKFLEKTQHAEPVVAAIEQSGKLIGYFTGLIVRRYGVKILGSPFRGWSTEYMGFNLLPDIPRREVLKALPSFVFDQLKCHHLEIVDRSISEEDYVGLGYTPVLYRTFEIDLTKSEEDLFASMKSACRRCIRKAEKNGVYIEQAVDMEFADDYYDQLCDVFAKQSLVPKYPKTFVQEMIKHLLPTGNLLMLRARSKDGLCIGTGIFPAFNNTMIFWGGASWREHQLLRPNETIMWYAMRYWKSRGIKKFDILGGMYKKKYGVYSIPVSRLIMGKYGMLVKLRDLAKKMVKSRQIVLGHVKRW